MSSPDAVIVGSGPNGLTAAARLARAGLNVRVFEAEDTIGGGTRTAELAEPGFWSDVCSAIHPFGVVSPAFRSLDAAIDWVTPPVAVSHPLGDGRAAALHNSVVETSRALSGRDGERWAELIGPLTDDLDSLVRTFLAPRIIPNPASKAARTMALQGARPATALAGHFESVEAQALIAGLAAHSIAPLDHLFTSGVVLLFAAIGNSVGWPLARGGSERISEALARIVVSGGGEIVTGERVSDLDEFGDSTVFLDLNPHEARTVGRLRMNPADIITLGRWTPGPGVFKIDYSLDAAIPWSDPISPHAGTVHIGGTLEEIVAAEAEVAAGHHPARPFVLLTQQSDFDTTRAPEGKRTGWAYCHVPNGSEVDMTEAIEDQIERFAPGFRSIIRARHVRDAPGFEAYDSNYVGGDIGGGEFSIKRFIPKLKNPYRVGDRLYICSAATPPGGGAHGLCGWHAAGSAAGSLLSRTPAPPSG